MNQNKLASYIKFEDDLSVLRKKMSDIASTPANKKSVVLNVSMCTYYAADDIPEELSLFDKKEKFKNATALCKELCKLYVELLNKKTDTAFEFLHTSLNAELFPDKSDMNDVFLLKLAELSAILNIFEDYMEDQVYQMGEDINSVCDPFDKKMYTLYEKAGIKLINEYINIAFS